MALDRLDYSQSDLLTASINILGKHLSEQFTKELDDFHKSLVQKYRAKFQNECLAHFKNLRFRMEENGMTRELIVTIEIPQVVIK